MISIEGPDAGAAGAGAGAGLAADFLLLLGGGEGGEAGEAGGGFFLFFDGSLLSTAKSRGCCGPSFRTWMPFLCSLCAHVRYYNYVVREWHLPSQVGDSECASQEESKEDRGKT